MTIKTIFKDCLGKCVCVDCLRDDKPDSQSCIVGMSLVDYLDTLGIIIDDCLTYALFDAADMRIKYRKYGGTIIIYVTYVKCI